MNHIDYLKLGFLVTDQLTYLIPFWERHKKGGWAFEYFIVQLNQTQKPLIIVRVAENREILNSITLSQQRLFSSITLSQQRVFNSITLSQQRLFNSITLSQQRLFNSITLSQL